MAGEAGRRLAPRRDRGRSFRLFRLALLAGHEAAHSIEHAGAAALQPQAFLPVPRARPARRDRPDAQARSAEEAAALSQDALRGRRRGAARAAGSGDAAWASRPGDAGSALRERAARLGVDAPEARRSEPRHGRGAHLRQGLEGAPGPARGGGARVAFALLEGSASRAAEEAPERLRLRDRARGADDAAGFLATAQAARGERDPRKAAVAAHAAPRFCDAPAQSRRGPARGAALARPRRHFDDADLHTRCTRALEGTASKASPSRVIVYALSRLRERARVRVRVRVSRPASFDRHAHLFRLAQHAELGNAHLDAR